MQFFDIRLTDGSRFVRVRFSAPDEVFAIMKADAWFDDSRWQRVSVTRVA